MTDSDAGRCNLWNCENCENVSEKQCIPHNHTQTKRLCVRLRWVTITSILPTVQFVILFSRTQPITKKIPTWKMMKKPQYYSFVDFTKLLLFIRMRYLRVGEFWCNWKKLQHAHEKVCINNVPLRSIERRRLVDTALFAQSFFYDLLNC